MLRFELQVVSEGLGISIPILFRDAYRKAYGQIDEVKLKQEYDQMCKSGVVPNFVIAHVGTTQRGL